MCLQRIRWRNRDSAFSTVSGYLALGGRSLKSKRKNLRPFERWLYMLPENSEVRKFMYCLTRSGNSWIARHRQEIHEFPKMARKFMNFLKLRLSHFTIFLKGNVAIVWLERQCETSAFVFTHQLKSGPCNWLVIFGIQDDSNNNLLTCDSTKIKTKRKKRTRKKHD